jgi:hypothetical protein
VINSLAALLDPKDAILTAISLPLNCHFRIWDILRAIPDHLILDPSVGGSIPLGPTKNPNTILGDTHSFIGAPSDQMGPCWGNRARDDARRSAISTRTGLSESCGASARELLAFNGRFERVVPLLGV